MNCCGKKRAQWMEETAAETGKADPITDPAEPVQAQNPKWFQYVGDSSLTLTGISTRQVYHFPVAGAQLEVAYVDSFAMMAERDLRSVPDSSMAPGGRT